MRISDWSSDVCSSDLVIAPDPAAPAPAPDPADMATQCDADAAQSYIGQDASEATVAEAQADAGATGPLRAIQPGQPGTQDFRDHRLNLEVEDEKAPVRTTCGLLGRREPPPDRKSVE